ncbi:MAG: DUF4124 domain-containing protein [Gammaproteobacteria bacterium]|nr:DUF4124 domain-containing protein [Gammaproteobacteria bacterium]
MQLSPKLIALSLLLVSTSTFSIELYKWKDENGRVHYGQVKPTKYKSLEIDAPPPPPSFAPNPNKPFTDAIEQSLEADKMKDHQRQQAKQQAAQKKADKAECAKARDNLQQMQTFRRARTTNPDGSVSMMSEEDRQGKIKEAQELVDQYCK